MDSSIKDLTEGVCFVEIVFSDYSTRVIRTTLNKDILISHGVQPCRDYFFDLDRNIFIKFPKEVTEINITKEKPENRLEVVNFVNRFIGAK